MSKNKVSYEKKVEIVRDYLDGRVGYKESIQRANNSAASFRHWVHLYKGNGAAGLLPNSRTRYIWRIQSGKRCRNTSPATVVWNLSAKNTRSGQQVNSEAG